jgi:hypothetical protein
MNNPKYVNTPGGMVIFSSAMQHSEFGHMGPTSAGFLTISEDPDTREPKAVCWGRSESLNLECDENDSIRATRLLNLDMY